LNNNFEDKRKISNLSTGTEIYFTNNFLNYAM